MNKHMRYPHFELWNERLETSYNSRWGWLSPEHMYAYANSDFDREKLMYSETGRKLMEAASLLKYESAEDPQLLKYWDNMGLEYKSHSLNGHTWLSFVPKCAFEEGAAKLPAVLCFHICEGRGALTMEMQFHELLKLAAQGDMIVLSCSTESEEENEIFTEILKIAKERWPIDDTRVYTTGHSHYGRFALKYACRHPEVAAVMQTGSYAMLCPLRGEVYPEVIQHDIPIIHATGLTEHNCPFPICNNASGTEHIPQWLIDRGEFPWDKAGRTKAWKRRLVYMNCPISTDEEIEAAIANDRCSAVLSIKADHTEILYLDGVELYIADIVNNNGDSHFRVVGVENQPHILFPATIDVCWSWARNFARDQETFKVIELK